MRLLRHTLGWLVTVAGVAVVGLSVTLWVRSYTVGDHPSLSIRTGDVADRFVLLELLSTRAGMSLHVQHIGADPAELGATHWAHEGRTYWDWHSWAPPGGLLPTSGPLAARLGFGWGHQAGSSAGGWMRSVRRWWVAFPHWFGVVAGAVPVGLRVTGLARARHRRQRARRGLCRTCGYDLRGSAERCPECGTPVGGDIAAGSDKTR